MFRIKKTFDNVCSLFCSFFDDETAQSTVEYVIIASAMCVFAYGAIRVFKDALASAFRKTARMRSGLLGMGP